MKFFANLESWIGSAIEGLTSSAGISWFYHPNFEHSPPDLPRLLAASTTSITLLYFSLKGTALMMLCILYQSLAAVKKSAAFSVDSQAALKIEIKDVVLGLKVLLNYLATQLSFDSSPLV